MIWPPFRQEGQNTPRMHPADDPENADLVAEVRLVAERILAAVKLLNPRDYQVFWELKSTPDPYLPRAYATVGEFRISCSIDGWVTADLAGSLVFAGWLGDGPLEYCWEPGPRLTALLDALQAVLVLEDLAAGF